jgi:predicted enzyme related to lactoylglutathione lyase
LLPGPSGNLQRFNEAEGVYAMNRFHVHLHVTDLEQSIQFYSTLFGRAPTRVKPGYAKWMLEDPAVNFALSVGKPAGISHLGLQVETDDDLTEVSARAQAAAGTVLVEKGARCCYATGNKAWAEDPQGVVWETFHTVGDLEEPGSGAEASFKNDVPVVGAGSCGCSTNRQEASCCA